MSIYELGRVTSDAERQMLAERSVQSGNRLRAIA